MTHDSLGHAADENMPQAGPSVRWNDNQIDISFHQIANLRDWRAFPDPNGISHVRLRRHFIHFRLRGSAGFLYEPGRMDPGIFIAEWKAKRIDYVRQQQLRVEFAGQPDAALKRHHRAVGKIERHKNLS